MNDDLKKTRRPATDRQKRYMSRHTILCVTLDNYDDGDIINWLSTQGHRKKSEAVRAALKSQIKVNGGA